MPISPSNVKPPLAQLDNIFPSFYAGPYNFTSLQYPQNLGDITNFEGHYINFYINVQNFSKFWSQGGMYGLNVMQTASPSNYVETNAPGVGGTQVPGTESWGAAVQESFYTRITQAISLYIPDTMQTNQPIQWDDSSILSLGQGMSNAIRKSSGDSGGMKDPKGDLKSNSMNPIRTTSKTLENFGGVFRDVAGVAGVAINPQLLVIFRGVVNRHFSYEFYFTPRNESEAKAVRDIITAFRYHAAPEPGTSIGAFFIAPSTFDIEFIHKGRRNTNIHGIKTCVLQNYSIDYAPAGWSTYNDGMPVQTKLILNFMETDLIQKPDVEHGF